MGYLSSIKLFVAITTLVYAVIFGVVLEKNKDIQRLMEFLNNNKLNMIIISIALAFYIVVTFFWNSGIIYSFIKPNIKFKIEFINKSISVVLTILVLVVFSFGLYTLFLSIFHTFYYEYSTMKMPFLFYVIYYFTFISFVMALRDLFKLLNDRFKVKFLFNRRYYILALIIIISIIFSIYLDKSKLNYDSIEAIFTGISTIFVLLTISISSFISFFREQHHSSVKKDLEN
ncbi:hypothetical protein [Pseudalkalibacillus sp. SCS-8]|uniref:hypothetical protein n=1 Tax=Pseudalkalibacillus nanhaiensis TaxID=3115291 RepID=UPI0032DBC493